jgi:Tfp pilus assembly PilM family ATPase
MSSLLDQLRRTPPRSNNEAWLGIDVGTCGVKMAEVVRAGFSWRATSAAFLPVDLEAGLDQRSLPAGQLRRVLARELELSGALGRNAAVVLSMSCVDYRRLDLPIASEEDRDLMVEQELEQAGSESPISGHWRCGPSPKNPHELEEVDVVTLQPQIARAVIEDLLSFGLSCQVIDGLPFVLARAGQMCAAAPTGPVAVLDWGFSTATLTVAQNGAPVFTRCLRDCGLRLAASALAERLRLSLTDAAQLLSAADTGCGNVEPRSRGLTAAIADCLHPAFDALGHEVRKTLSYLTQRSGCAVPEKVLLVGGGGLLPHVEERLIREIGREVRLWQLTNFDSRPAGQDALFASAYMLSALGDML